jgi:carbon storage regulator
MLVLSRKRTEAIVVGDNIRITVLQINGDRVKLGIEAPLTVPVHRAEIQRCIFEEHISAVQVALN